MAKKGPKPVRTETIGIRVTKEVEAKLKKEANKRYMSVSALAFIIIKKTLDKMQ